MPTMVQLDTRLRAVEIDQAGLKSDLRNHAERSEQRHDELMKRLDKLNAPSGETPDGAPARKGKSNELRIPLTPGNLKEIVLLLAYLAAALGIAGGGVAIGTAAADPTPTSVHQEATP